MRKSLMLTPGVAGLLLTVVGCAPAQPVTSGDLATAIDEAAPGATLHLEPDAGYGPIVIDKPLTLIGAPGARIEAAVTGTGITIENTADVTLDGVSVNGGEVGILVTSSTNVQILDSVVEGAHRRGILVRDGQAIVDRCIVRKMTSPLARGIEIINAEAHSPSIIRNCDILGPVWEGFASRLAHVRVENNRVSGSNQRGIAVTEMSTGVVNANTVTDAAGNAYFCGDMSNCTLNDNSAARIRQGEAPMLSSGGHAIVVQYHSLATIGPMSVEDVAGTSIFTSVNGVVNAPDAARPNPIWLVVAAGIAISLAAIAWRRLTSSHSRPRR